MEKLKRSRLFNRLNSMSIRMTFVLYALFSLLIGIIICILLISMVDRYRINLNYKYENLSTRYDIPENGSFTATYSNDQTKYTIFDTKGNEICKFNVDYQKERPVHEYVYPNHVSYIEVLPNFTNRDRLIDSVQFTTPSGLHSVLERPFSEANGRPFLVKRSPLIVC